MVFIGLGRFHRSTLTHHSLCWGKAGKRMQKTIFFAFCSPIRPPHVFWSSPVLFGNYIRLPKGSIMEACRADSRIFKYIYISLFPPSRGLHLHHIRDNPDQAKYIDISIYFYIPNRRPRGALWNERRTKNYRDRFLENNIDFFGPTCAISSLIYLPLQTQYLEYLGWWRHLLAWYGRSRVLAANSEP